MTGKEGYIVKNQSAIAIVFTLLFALVARAAGDGEKVLSIPPEYKILADELNRSVRHEGPHMPVPVFKYRLPTQEELGTYPTLWRFLTPEGNAAFLYARALAHYDRSLEPPAGSKSSAEQYLADLEALRQYIGKHLDTINILKEAAEYEDCSFPVVHRMEVKGRPRPSPPYVGIGLAGMRQMARTLSDAAFVAEESEKPAEAAELCLTGLRMAKHVAEGNVLALLVGQACTSIASDSLSRVVANNDLPKLALRGVIFTAQNGEMSHSDLAACYEIERVYAEYMLSQPDFD